MAQNTENARVAIDRQYQATVRRHVQQALRRLNDAHRTLGELIDRLEKVNYDKRLTGQRLPGWGIDGVVTDVVEAKARLAIVDELQDAEALIFPDIALSEGTVTP